MSKFYLNAVQRGNLILLREWDTQLNQEVRRKVKYSPTHFVRSKNSSTKFKSLANEPLVPKKFETIRDAKDFVEEYDGVQGYKVYGTDNYLESFLNEEYKGDVRYDKSKIRTFDIDIEVHSAVQKYGDEIKVRMNGSEKMVKCKNLREKIHKMRESGMEIMTHNGWEDVKYFRFTEDDAFPDPKRAEWPITLIGIHDSFTGKDHVWGFGNLEWDPINPCRTYSKEEHIKNIAKYGGQDGINVDDIVYHDCENEEELLIDFLKFWNVNMPTVVTGWNIAGFDIPYIGNRITHLFGADMLNMLSPWELIRKSSKEDDYGNEVDKYSIQGVSILDSLVNYKKWSFNNLESFKLDFVASHELGTKKLSYEESGNLRNLYRENYQKYCEYNVLDVKLPRDIEAKRKFLDVIYTIAFMAKINFESVYSPVQTWDALATNYLLVEKGICVNAYFKRGKKDRKYAGAFVKEPQLGKKGWTVSVDLDSLYPHLFIQTNTSVETHVPRDKLPENLQSALNNIRTYDLDEYGDPVIDGENGRDAYIMRMVKGEIDLSAFAGTKYSVAGNLEVYDRTQQSFVSEMMEDFYAKRKFAKKQMLRYDQEAVWIKEEIAARKAGKSSNLSAEEINKNRPPELKLESEFFFDSTLNDNELFTLLHKVENEVARLDCLQSSLKVNLNSLYGAFGSIYFRFFYIPFCESITLTGQLAIQYIAYHLSREINRILKNDKLPNGDYETNYVTYIDTDSNYLNFDDVVKKFKPVEYEKAANGCTESRDIIVDFVDAMFKKHFDKFMADSYQNMADYLNSAKQAMNMSREVIADKGFWTGKKRYMLNVMNSEGVAYKDGKMKIMGMESIKSTTPEIVRKWLKEMYVIVLNKDEKAFQQQIAEYREIWKTLPVNEIAKNASCNGLKKYADPDTIFVQKASWQARCGLLYNHLVKVNGLEREIDMILDGDKVKLIELKEPNPVRYSKIAFPTFLSDKLGLEKYIDRDLAFEKNFLAPLKTFMEVLKWEPNEPTSNSLDDFFC